MEYRCVCGKVFNSSQAFNSHRASCEAYLKSVEKWESRCLRIREGSRHANEVHKINNELRKKSKLERWVAEKHKCEHCGKIMTEKFGSGRFCSRACANSHKVSEETKQKIANSIAKSPLLYTEGGHIVQQQAINRYKASVKYCPICGNEIPYERRNFKTCSDNCYHALLSKKAKARGFGGLTNGCGNYSKHGSYKGIHCDSTYELIYLVYCLENNIEIQRNKKYFNYYNTSGELKKYYPDFYLPKTNTYIELKGYKDGNVELKLEAVKKAGSNIEILYKADLIDKISFINKKLNKNYNINTANIAELYDN